MPAARPRPRIWNVRAHVHSLLQAAWLQRAVLLARRSFREFFADHCQQMAAAISFHLLFSLFPLAIAAVGVIGLVTQDPHAHDTVVTAVLRAVPLSADGKNQLEDLLTSVSGQAGALGVLGILGVIWAASGVMAAVRTALNIAWDTDHKRPFVRGKIVDLILVACVLLVTGAALGITILASIIRHGVHLPAALRFLDPLAGVAASAGAYLAAAAVLFATFVFLYRFVPAVPTRLRDIWPGALAAAAGFEALQYGFSLYITYFSHYNKIYGSLGAIVAFLFFIYLASAVFLFGAEIASEYPRMRGVSQAGTRRSREDDPPGTPSPPGHAGHAGHAGRTARKGGWPALSALLGTGAREKHGEMAPAGVSRAQTRAAGAGKPCRRRSWRMSPRARAASHSSLAPGGLPVRCDMCEAAYMHAVLPAWPLARR